MLVQLEKKRTHLENSKWKVLYPSKLNKNLLSEAEVVPVNLSGMQGLQASCMQNAGRSRQSFLSGTLTQEEDFLTEGLAESVQTLPFLGPVSKFPPYCEPWALLSRNG